ncbi:histidine kinase [Methylobacterium sp. 77]|uniref:sensor histidine kinase n=1 Tax=Methylobacterium sp. 77 TaxID=1101192 RepID=UPI000367B0EB|nr:histidine kinase [Methylobacterium sp. 77]
MSLLSRLLLRFLMVAALCLAGTAAWIVRETQDGLTGEAATSAARVAAQLARQPGLGSADLGQRLPGQDWQAMPTILTIVPGICVEIAIQAEARQRLCNGWDGVGDPAPAWFRSLFDMTFDSSAPILRSIDYRGRSIGTVGAFAEREAASTRAWRQVRLTVGIAAAMALATALLTALAARPLLTPVGAIVAGLHGLERGNEVGPLPRFGIREFDRIAGAFDAMAARLRASRDEAAALTLRLFQVQEDERRILARDLHDEFGQCLTAAASLAEAVEMGAGEDRPDLAGDAQAIGRITDRMMATLKSALSRLQPPDLDEIGFEGSLRGLVAGWNLHRREAARFRIDVAGDFAGMPAQAALGLYRVAQELLTNAVRHGRPSRVILRISREENGHQPVTLVVDDDGGGDPASIDTRTGRGLLFIRERIAALGGTLSIGASAGGIRACAVVPTRA